MKSRRLVAPAARPLSDCPDSYESSAGLTGGPCGLEVAPQQTTHHNPNQAVRHGTDLEHGPDRDGQCQHASHPCAERCRGAGKYLVRARYSAKGMLGDVGLSHRDTHHVPDRVREPVDGQEDGRDPEFVREAQPGNDAGTQHERDECATGPAQLADEGDGKTGAEK